MTVADAPIGHHDACASGGQGRTVGPLGPLFTAWAPGPAEAAANSDGVIVSVTDFAAARLRDAPMIALTGMRLREGWYAMPGAVGLWLWSLPLERRSGSVSVWTSDEDLRRFVKLPAHLAIMRRFKKAGRLRSATWHAERFAATATMGRARRWIATPCSSAP